MDRDRIDALKDLAPAVFPHYITPPRTVGFMVIGPPLIADVQVDTEEEALLEAATRIAAYSTPRITINRIETHLEVIK